MKNLFSSLKKGYHMAHDRIIIVRFILFQKNFIKNLFISNFFNIFAQKYIILGNNMLKGLFLKVYTVLVLIKNLTFRKKRYKLHFVAETDGPIKRWFYDFKHWGFDHMCLEMVSGADNLCDYFSSGGNEATIDVICSKKKLSVGSQWLELEAIPPISDFGFLDRMLYGRNYKVKDSTIWICMVTLFVIGRYPNYLYIKRHD